MMGRRVALVSVAGALVAVVVAAAAVAAGHRCRGIEADGPQRYVDPAGWSLAYPHTMYIESSSAQLRISVAEVTIASFPPIAAVSSGRTATGAWLRVDPPRNEQGVFPADGVAFRILSREGGPMPKVDLPETHFPLRLSSFEPSSDYPGTIPTPVERTIVVNGLTYPAQAWVGAQASSALRTTIGEVVSSLSFPRLRVGETVGTGFRVLQPASRYPVGTFVRIRVGSQPLYLVHAPGGFYAIDWRWQTLSGGYKSHCDLRLDRRAAQFYCANLTARWDRIGRVVVRAHGASRGDPLNMALAKTAWDGHVLINPGISHFATADDAHRFWPGWRPHSGAHSP
jgi:hypothetical protein